MALKLGIFIRKRISNQTIANPQNLCFKPKQTHLANPNQNPQTSTTDPQPIQTRIHSSTANPQITQMLMLIHTNTHEPLLTHSMASPKDHKNQHRSTPKPTSTTYPHHDAVTKTTREKKGTRESKRGLRVEEDEGVIKSEMKGLTVEDG